MQKSVQDLYPDSYSYCYGCGRLNDHGLQIKSYLVGEDLVCEITPELYHMAVPGFVYGGLIASIIDCHSIGTAAAFDLPANHQDLLVGDAPRYVTKSLHVDFLKPTPIEEIISAHAQVIERGERHRIVRAKIFSAGDLRATGEVVAVPIPEPMLPAD